MDKQQEAYNTKRRIKWLTSERENCIEKQRRKRRKKEEEEVDE